jgi:hypothetical protein
MTGRIRNFANMVVHQPKLDSLTAAIVSIFTFTILRFIQAKFTDNYSTANTGIIPYSTTPVFAFTPMNHNIPACDKTNVIDR